jgi:hypothetical protein
MLMRRRASSESRVRGPRRLVTIFFTGSRRLALTAFFAGAFAFAPAFAFLFAFTGSTPQ